MAWPGWEHFTPHERHASPNREAVQPTRPNKYRNVKTPAVDGLPCDSKREASRWGELLLMQQAGVITDLLPHPSFPLFVNGTRTGRYTADALYVESGRLIVEDTKSRITAEHRAFRQRLRLFEACYPQITVRLV